MISRYQPAIGLEIHAELATRAKMFCDCLNDPFEKKPNANICPICAGHPGTLPVINQQAVEAVLKIGLALGAEIPEVSKFDRKNYFYPDLPKGYQISQYDEPLCVGGHLEIRATSSKFQVPSSKFMRIRRIHLEEDTGKLIHPDGADYSLIDFNRAGVPLAELVTEPDLQSAEEASVFAEELQLLLRYLNVSGADMERGQMRLEANISVAREAPSSNFQAPNRLGTKVEVKNLNSFRALEEAIRYEIKRQTELLEAGKDVLQETRGWDDVKKETFSQRLKEGAEDYRYFPEPDLPPIRIANGRASPAFAGGPSLQLASFDLEKIRREIPELPAEKQARFEKEYGLAALDARALAAEPELAEFFEKVSSELAALDAGRDDPKDLAKFAFNYLFSDLRGLMAAAKLKIVDTRIAPKDFARLMLMARRGEISSRGAKDALSLMFRTGESPESIIRAEGLTQVSDQARLKAIILAVIEENPQAVADYRKGKVASLQFLVGKAMAKSKGAANPKVVEEMLMQELSP